MAFREGFTRGDSDAIESGGNWVETRTAHFNIYSQSSTPEVNSLAVRLEQFREAYGQLAGAQAVASAPVIVLAFPDFDSMQPYLPLYDGKPANMAGFFIRRPDENLIVLSLDEQGSGSLPVIYHEYAHLLFRRNDAFWPPWLSEGMAEIYSTFEASGRGVSIAKPIGHHIEVLTNGELMPLDELLNVTHDAPQYNERDLQGMFYAESWLLAHFLMNGDNPALKSRFGLYTRLLIAGEGSEQAFTNALGMPLKGIEAELKRYLKDGNFQPISFIVKNQLSAPNAMQTRPVGRVELLFRLGDEQMRINRLDRAREYFERARTLAPASPLPYEGLGLLAGFQQQHEESARQLKMSIDRGAVSFLAHYNYAMEKMLGAGDAEGRFHSKLPDALASQIQAELKRTVMIMPDFGPAQHELGFLEMLQGNDVVGAEQHLLRAIQLEPENRSYLLSLAQAQMLQKDYAAARNTLKPLCVANVSPELRSSAESVMSEIAREEAGQK